MNWSIQFDPLVAWPLIGILGVAVALIIGLMVWRKPAAAPLRAVALGLLVLALANPVIVTEERRALESVLAVIVDESESQRIGERDEATRLALERINDQVRNIDGLSTRVSVVGPSEGSLRGDGTLAFSALQSVLADVPPDQVAGAIFVTDGQVHDVPSSLSALGFDAPIHGLLTGQDDERDRRVEIIESPRFGIVGEIEDVSVRVLDQPGGSASPIDLIIKQDGVEIARERARHGEVITFPVEINHAGDIYITVEADVLAGEITEVNNRAVATIEGIRETLRVLLVSGEPHAGERTWRNLLKSDAAVDLVHFTILRPPEKQDGTPINQLSLIAFPTRELFSVKIDEFDLIIFDRYKRRGVLPRLYFENIARYVENGGAVLVASGPDYAEGGSLYNTSLAEVLPGVPTGQVLSEAFRPTVTDLGQRHPVTRNLPGSRAEPPAWSPWFRLVEADVREGEVVMNGPDDRPLLILNRVGDGRMALLLSDHAWLWARGYEGGGPHLQLLRRLGHWLMKEPDLEEEALTVTVDGDQIVLERRTVATDVPPTELTLPSGNVMSVELEEATPGVWRAVIEAEETGLYQASDGALTALGHLGPVNSREFADLLSTTEMLEPIVEASGGALVRLAAESSAEVVVPAINLISETTRYGGRGWLGLKRTDASVLEGLNRLPLFAGLLGLALLLGLVSLMWYREGR